MTDAKKGGKASCTRRKTDHNSVVWLLDPLNVPLVKFSLVIAAFSKSPSLFVLKNACLWQQKHSVSVIFVFREKSQFDLDVVYNAKMKKKNIEWPSARSCTEWRSVPCSRESHSAAGVFIVPLSMLEARVISWKHCDSARPSASLRGVPRHGAGATRGADTARASSSPRPFATNSKHANAGQFRPFAQEHCTTATQYRGVSVHITENMQSGRQIQHVLVRPLFFQNTSLLFVFFLCCTTDKGIDYAERANRI